MPPRDTAIQTIKDNPGIDPGDLWDHLVRKLDWGIILTRVANLCYSQRENECEWHCDFVIPMKVCGESLYQVLSVKGWE